MNVLIALYDYFPNHSANSICTKYIIDAMLKKDINVHIICVKSDPTTKSFEIKDGVFVHRIDLREDSFARRLRLRKGKLWMYPKAIISKYYEYSSFYGSCGYTRSFQNHHVIENMERIIEKYEIDTLLSVSYPFSTHEACKTIKIKMPYLKWVCYELDPFAFNYTLPNKQCEHRKKQELMCFLHSDFIISTLGINEYNERKGFRLEYKDKTLSVPLPGLVVKNDISKDLTILEKDDGKINLIYTGQFYGSLRSPVPLLKLLENDASNNIVFHIIGGIIGLDAPVSGKYEIKEYPRSSVEVCDSSIVDADVAINFDNKIPNQAPSKLLSYMALGLPIVNFYYKGCEIGESYLKNYEPHLSICVDDVEKDNTIKSFYNFINKYGKGHDNKRIVNIDCSLENNNVCEKIIDSICSVSNI